jgi:hypothetical protein
MRTQATTGFLVLALGILPVTGCGSGGSHKDKKSNAAAPDDGTAGADQTAESQDANQQAGGEVKPATNTTTTPVSDQSELDKLVALGPNGLALKIRSAFGAGLTDYDVGGNKMDYILVNGPNFTGAVSPDPTTTIPAKLASVNYFLALYGLADVVGQNYAARLLGNGIVANDCREQAGAEAIVRIVYPPIEDADLKAIAGNVVTACKSGDIMQTVNAIMSSYAFPLDSSH